MATTGQKYPTLAVTAAESPWLDNNWNTPTNIYADDAATANVIATSFDSPDQTYVLKAYTFDFSGIPDGSTINGVTCRINTWYRSGQGAGSLDLLQLLDTSLAKVGTNQCATPVALTTTDTTIITKGGAADLWGNALTAAWVKNANFGVAIGIAATAANADVDVDYVTLEIDYTPANVTVTPTPISGVVASLIGAILLGSIAITPTPASAVTASIDPTVVMSSISVTPAVSSAVATKIDPTIVLGSISLIPTVNSAIATKIDPTVIASGGSITITPSAATLTSCNESGFDIIIDEELVMWRWDETSGGDGSI